MPGETKEKKKMYIGKSLSDLNKMVDREIDKSKSNLKRLEKSAVKMMEEANKAYKARDEERAYILYMRYALTWRTVTGANKDQKNVEFLNKKDVAIAIKHAEELSKSLEARYKDSLEEEEVKKGSEEVITNGSETDGLIENGVAEALEEDTLGSDGWLSSIELYEVLRDGGVTILVMDVRSADQFASSQMKNIPTVNIPREIIKAGATVKSIEVGLPSDSVPEWKRRGGYDYVLLMDWESSVGDLKQGSTVTSLKDALYKWDSVKTLQQEPLILRGGYTDWVLRYPMYSSNPRVAKPPSYDSLMKPKGSLDFDYPDLDDKPPQVPPPVTLPSEPQASSQAAASKNLPSVNRTLKPQTVDRHPTPSTNSQPSHISSQAAPAVLTVLANQLGEGGNRNATNPSLVENDIKNDIASNVSPVQEARGSEKTSSIPTVDRSAKPRHVDVRSGAEDEKTRCKEVRSTEEMGEILPPPVNEGETELKEQEEFQALRQKEEKVRADLDRMRSEKTRMENKELRKEKQALEENIRSQQEEMQRLKAEMDALKIRQSKPKPAVKSTPGTGQGATNKSASQDQITKIPEGWQMKFDHKRGRYYYIDHSTKTSHWELPAKAWNKGSDGAPTPSAGKSGSTSSAAKPSPSSHAATPKPTTPSQTISAQPAKDQSKPDSLKLAKPTSPTPQRTAKVPLKSATMDSPGPSTLKRSFSSPNIAKMMEDEEQFRKTPTIDRSKKPSNSRPTPAQVHHHLTVRKRNLDPVYGSQARALTGLRNLGNTCFMNSVVQCLSNTTLLTKYFLDDTYLKDINQNNPLGRRGEVAVEFAVVVKALWVGQYKSIAPRDLLRTVIKYVPEFNQKVGHHHDSQEFLVFLMDGLHEDLNQVKERQYVKEEDFSHLPPSEGSQKSWNNHLILNRSVIVNLFQGQFRSTVRCLTCKNDSIKYEAFMYLELPIPSKTKCTLQDCLEKFQTVEKLAGNNATFCSKCKRLQDSVKTIRIWKLPHILIIHLKRFYYEGMWRQKLQTNVDYPLNSLDMRRYTQNPVQEGGGVYNLYGVSNHTGTLDGGHYTAYCKSAVNNKWYKYDDTEVFDCSVGKIRSTGAYILFYTSVYLPEP